MKRFLVILALLLPLNAWAGLDEGVNAYADGDYATALKEFRALADQGHAEGQYFVGLFNHNGYGIKRDAAEAHKWFMKAANQGDARSQYYVGIMYAAGKGVTKDLPVGNMWLLLSAANPNSNYRDSLYTKEEIVKLEKKMTPEQVAQSKDMAKNWKPQN